MSAVALRGRRSTESQPPDWATNPKTASDDCALFHPDVLAVARDLGIVRPRSLRHLQRLYDQYVVSADADFDFGRYVLTYADNTGETATAHVLREQIQRRIG